MRETFIIEDLLDVLIELENLGNTHYTKMADTAEDEKLKQLFELLARQEMVHRNIYQNYKNEKIVFETHTVTPEYKDYIKALIENTMSFLNETKTCENFKIGYEKAILLEKETLLFLNEMKQILPEENHFEINQLMDEERKHLKFLIQYQ